VSVPVAAEGPPAARTLPTAEPPAPPAADVTAAAAAAEVAATAAQTSEPFAARTGDASASTIPLELTFAAESWAEVTDARGERLFVGLGAAGQQVRVNGEPPFAVVLGNAEGVQLLVDGQVYPIPTLGRQGNIARFTVDIAEE
jgi:cytoskeleton protein RodZ